LIFAEYSDLHGSHLDVRVPGPITLMSPNHAML